jgi:predicted RecB family endonuclease
MITMLKNLFQSKSFAKKNSKIGSSSLKLENKVEKGTARAVKEYGRAFKKLSAYDRS